MFSHYMSDRKVLEEQYKDGSKLNFRQLFHKKYSTNKQEYGDWIMENIPNLEGKSVLDIGCGNGNLWKKHSQIIGRINRLVLADRSSGMISEVKGIFSDYASVSCIEADICNLPFEANTFDIVIANSMLYHVNDLDRAISEVYRILKQDGFFISTTFSKYGLNGYINDAMIEMGFVDPLKREKVTFSLEDGACLIGKYFPEVHQQIYEGYLDVTCPEDIVRYVFSMASMKEISLNNWDRMVSFFSQRADDRGIIRIPKIYGMFSAKKSI